MRVIMILKLIERKPVTLENAFLGFTAPFFVILEVN